MLLLDEICRERESVLEDIGDPGLATISSRIVGLVKRAFSTQRKTVAKDISDYGGLLSDEALEKASIGVAIPIANNRTQSVTVCNDMCGSVAAGATLCGVDVMTLILDGGSRTQAVRIARKMAADQEPTPRVSVQSFMPVSPKRRLTNDEQRQVQRGRSRWFPEIFQGYGTPLPNMLASPGRQALLAGLGGAVGGGLLGANIGAKITTPHDAPLSVGSTPTLAGGGAGAIGLGGIAALVTYLQRQAKNEGVIDLMKRLPEGGTKRDLLSDPVVQADRQRDAMRSMYGNDDRFKSRLPATCSRFWQQFPCAPRERRTSPAHRSCMRHHHRRAGSSYVVSVNRRRVGVGRT